MMLREYLIMPRQKWDWVHMDCSRWLDGWLVRRRWGSAMDAIGISYTGPREALELITNAGGLLPLWERGMDALGLAQAIAPNKEGDVAILSIATDDGTNETTGIWTGSKWASLHRSGIVCGVGETLRVWSI